MLAAAQFSLLDPDDVAPRSSLTSTSPARLKPRVKPVKQPRHLRRAGRLSQASLFPFVYIGGTKASTFSFWFR
jgi:hypothetical protein